MNKQKFAVLIAVLAMVATLLGSMAQAAPNTAVNMKNSVAAQAVVSTDAPAIAQAKISPELRQQMAQAAQGSGKLGYMVMLKEQADTSNNISPLKWKAKGDYVYNKLQEVANRTQPAVKAQLESMKRGAVVSSYQSFWIANSFYVQGTVASINNLATNSAVSLLDVVTYYKPSDDAAVAPLLPAAPGAPEVIQPGVNRINAPAVWAQGYRGQGITIGSIDTGAIYTHEVLIRQYRGTLTGSDDWNWKDALDNLTTYPYDTGGSNSFHGTHTLGTTLGENALQTQQTGVAPDANWISCRVFGDNPNSGANFVILPCGEFMLAPTDRNGLNPRPELRPQVVGNSWGSNNGRDQFFRTTIVNWINAGIFPSFSNGNNGPSAGTVGSPASYPETFGVGATGTVNDNIAGFSSRGPSPIDGGLKPQVTAPGVNVISSVGPLSTTYGALSGTSMAQPHVAGTVALLLSKNRGLSVQELKNVLTSTAYFTTSMGTRPNNNYGWGRIDALAAANAVTERNGYLVGRVTDTSNNPLASVAVNAEGPAEYNTVTDANGNYRMVITADNDYDVNYLKYGYLPGLVSPVDIQLGMTTTRNISLTMASLSSISGTLTGPSGPVSGTVSIVSSPLTPTVANGSYSFSGLAAGSYQVVFEPTNNCLATISQSFTVPPAATVDLVTNYKRDNFGYNCDNNASFNYFDATTEITNWTGGNDDGAANIQIPAGFNFSYYGQPMAGMTVTVGTNGYAELNGAGDIVNGGSPIPNFPPPNDAIYAMLDDLVVDGITGKVFYGLDTSQANRRFVIEWRNAQHFGSDGNYGDYNFEIVLEEGTNSIYLQYDVMDGQDSDGDKAIVGIENADGSDGIEYSYQEAGALSTDTSIRFYYSAVTPTPAVTNTPIATSTPVPTVSPTTCPNPFVDISNNVFAPAILYLYCRGVVNGVDATHYGPAGTASRAQFAKVVVLGFGIASYTPVLPSFTDVPPTYFAYQYIEAGRNAGILSGYDAQTCVAIGALYPCYGPNRPITRAQLTKLVVAAGGFSLFTPTSGQTFSDVGPSNVFYVSIETAAHYGIVGGYSDNTFRPNNNIRRDEMAQIVYKGITTTPLGRRHEAGVWLLTLYAATFPAMA